MKQSALHASMTLTTCIWFIASSASAAPWWKNPALKYDEQLVGIYGAVDPHYMNKDESDQYLAFATGSGGGTVYLYSIPSLISGTSSNDVTPIAQGDMTNFWNTAWKGIALSDNLMRVFTGQTGSKPDHTSFPVTGPWVTNSTFNVTNDPTNVYFDGCDFGHTSEYLYSDVYDSGNAAVPKRTSIVKWHVTNLVTNGVGLVTNTVVTTSLQRVRNVSSYYIGGKDLVYYGEGNDGLAVSAGRKVCVYDFDQGTEGELTTLFRTNETGLANADVDIMNVKIGGVGLGQMHLYVQCNDGAVFIYNLKADGKSLGDLVKTITPAQMKALVGQPTLPRIRNFEITNDEKYAFVLNKPSSADLDDYMTKLHVLWTPPVDVAWWQTPSVKYCANTGYTDSDPHYMNKDEGDQYLFIPLFSSNPSRPGKLYSIPALIAATSSNDVSAIASSTPNDLYGNWKGGAISDALLRLVPGNGVPGSVTYFASLPLTAPWTKDATGFAITNDPSAWGMDGMDFSHTSEFLFSNIYNSGNRNKIVKWNVVNLNAAGLGFVTNTVFSSSLTRIRNISSYYIGGKDLIFYGEGETTAAGVYGQVCVYDPADGTETVLVSGLDRGSADTDIVNVKVGGVGLGQMHLYVETNNGALRIYNLNADGKSVGDLVRSFTAAQVKALLHNATFTIMRCFEVTNDEKFAFFAHHSSDQLYVVWTSPKGGTLVTAH